MSKTKKYIWKILLIIGILPFLGVLCYAIYSAIYGFKGLCFFYCTKEYGLLAFRDSIILYSIVYYPLYIIGAILVILSIIKIRKNNTNKRGNL